MIKESWDNVSVETIKKCFTKSFENALLGNDIQYGNSKENDADCNAYDAELDNCFVLDDILSSSSESNESSFEDPKKQT